MVKQACLEAVKFLPVAFADRLVNTATRGVCAEYGEMRNENAAEGRWLNSSDELERRRVVFLGYRVKDQLFSGRNALGETVEIGGMRFTVIGVMDRKLQLSNYFTSDDRSVFIPLTTAGDLWNTRYPQVMVFTPIAPSSRKKPRRRCWPRSRSARAFRPPTRRPSRCLGARNSAL